jgi:hypothetical protein
LGEKEKLNMKFFTGKSNNFSNIVEVLQTDCGDEG